MTHNIVAPWADKKASKRIPALSRRLHIKNHTLNDSREPSGPNMLQPYKLDVILQAIESSRTVVEARIEEIHVEFGLHQEDQRKLMARVTDSEHQLSDLNL
ncbi:hypothetical protein NDU88_005480 [Pleurodeles waltl]|uniref:Uncharacterized protein n=1 Tax=Pleurodeles waltl TaxID=8319 RepID=A0AAV7NQQ7_PLEWA|nr:hypothetical protein NDU88_005480 [Pleurodeles waltl]